MRHVYSRATGLVALSLAALTLFVEVGLVSTALVPPVLGPEQSDIARARELAARRDQVRVGLGVLVLGTGLAGAAVLVTRCNSGGGKLITAAGCCCLASMVAWFVLVITIYGNSVPKERDNPNSFTVTSG
ncbi:unnamed protein product [Gemmata massiliana]|uniref:Uncharacterized protein n=1 Tax=Gemmata massiliana TaxID=1210884 RepID=A0A6P2CWN1_9BACT|nr:hypothetical protein [Gemmata massiliana]VTR93548.1 unnamed protein product [Gemmata massiliana]